MKHPLRTLLLAVCCGLAAACTQRQERLKLMSYNIRNGIGIDNIQDIDRIARVILREAPDLVALQELDSATLRVDGRYIPGELGRMTGMHATFGRAIGFAGGSYGIGLLSRTEPLAVRSIPLPGREEARVLLMAEFPDYTVCITHLSLTPEDRLASLPIIREATDTCRKSVLLAGAAGYAAARFRRASLALLAAVVLFYQAAGTLGEWALTGSFHAAVQDFRIGLPGMLLQIFGGWAFINFIIRK